jgi:hypothetical protein
MASDVADAVRAAGGLLYDRSMCGWQVMVCLAECEDDRPLRVLGVDKVTLDIEGDDYVRPLWPDSFIVSAEIYRADAQVRARFGAASHKAGTEVAIWGSDLPSVIGVPDDRVEHRLTHAARAFKAQAIIAAGLPAAGMGRVETFHRVGSRLNMAAPLLLGLNPSTPETTATQPPPGPAP